MTLHDDNKLQRMEVLRVMADSQWRTLPQLSSALGNRYMVTSLSARLRDFRKEQFGSYRVERRLVPGSERLYEYRVLPPVAMGNQDAMPVGVVGSERRRSAAIQKELFQMAEERKGLHEAWEDVLMRHGLSRGEKTVDAMYAALAADRREGEQGRVSARCSTNDHAHCSGVFKTAGTDNLDVQHSCVCTCHREQAASGLREAAEDLLKVADEFYSAKLAVAREKLRAALTAPVEAAPGLPQTARDLRQN